MKYDVLHLKDLYPFLGTDGRDPTVERYMPHDAGGHHHQRPCLIVCPGGGYSHCSQRESEPIALHFLPQGFQVFVLTYSVAPHRFPTQLTEVAALMDLIHQQAEAWHCDTSKIVLMGFSAGGHLAAYYSTRFDCGDIRQYFPNSRPVHASILCYPVITADPAYAHNGSFNNLTGTALRTAEQINAFSCDRLVSDQTPPTFLWHTAADGSVPVMNSLLYAEALSRQHIPFELHIYPLGGHGSSTCDTQTNDTVGADLQHAAAWLDDVKTWLTFMGIA